MKVVFKMAVIIMALFAGTVVVAIFVAPGLRHGDEHIAAEYYFSHGSALGIQMSITKERHGEFTEVIGMKVEEFIVHDNAIFVTQRPVVPTGKLGQLTDTCLYYRIDIANHKVHGPFTFTEVKNQADWDFLKQRRPPADWGPTICKFDALVGV
jgi:hypothetical protein